MRCQSVHLPTEPKRVGGHMFCKCVLRIHAPVTPRRMQPYTVPAIQRPMNRSQKGGRQLQLASTARQMSYWYTCNISIRGKYTRCNGSMASKMGIHLWYCVTRQTGTNCLNTGTLHQITIRNNTVCMSRHNCNWGGFARGKDPVFVFQYQLKTAYCINLLNLIWWHCVILRTTLTLNDGLGRHIKWER